MQTKTQLIEIGRHYFEDKSIKLMYATSDGNFFYEASKTYADNHAKTLKTELIIITRADLASKPEKPKDEKPEINESEDALMARYKKETGKNAIFREKITKGYLNWKEENPEKPKDEKPEETK